MTTVRVLQVEDNRGDAVLLSEAAADAGIPYSFVCVGNGVAALDYLYQRGPYSGVSLPDLVVLDLKLPKKGGIEVLSETAADARLRDLCIVVISSSEYELKSAQKHGYPGVCFLAKPGTYDGYLSLIRTIEAHRLEWARQTAARTRWSGGEQEPAPGNGPL